MKNWKTTATGIVAAVLAVGETLLPFLEGTEDLNWVQVLSAVGMAILASLAKDHDKDNNEELARMDTGGVGPKRPPKGRDD